MLAIEGPKQPTSITSNDEGIDYDYKRDSERTYDILSRATLTHDTNKYNIVFEDENFKLNGYPIEIKGAYIRVRDDDYEMTPGLAYLMTHSKASHGDSIDKYDAYNYAMILSRTGIVLGRTNDKLNLLKKHGIVINNGNWCRVSLPTADDPGPAHLVPFAPVIASAYKPKPPTTPKPPSQRQLTKGNGLLPSNPLSLYKLLNLRLAAYKAGNTGLRNEVIAITDELLRQGVIKKGDYKKITMIVT